MHVLEKELGRKRITATKRAVAGSRIVRGVSVGHNIMLLVAYGWRRVVGKDRAVREPLPFRSTIGAGARAQRHHALPSSRGASAA